MNAAPPGLDNEWQVASQHDEVPEAGLHHVEVTDSNGVAHELHFCRLGEEVVAVEGPCPQCGQPLAAAAKLGNGVLACSCGGWSLNLQEQLAVDAQPHPNWRPVMLVDEDVYVWMNTAPVVE